MFTPAAALAVTAGQKEQLEALVRSGLTPQRVARKCRVVLLASQGVANHAIAQETGLSRPTVIAVRRAFARAGIAGIQRPQKRNKPCPILTPELQQRILDTTLKTKPAGETHWSVRSLARHLGLSRTMVHRVWQRFDLPPHRVEKFKLSHDPKFEEKVRDIVGLYLNPPDRALVTHDYKRYGTTTLFAAFNILNGKVMGSCLSRHRSQEFLRFLKQLEQEVPPDLEIHLILDNYSTHKSQAVQPWLQSRKRQRFQHFTPPAVRGSIK